MICSCHALFLKIIFETVFKLLQQSTFKEINKQRLLLIWIFILFFFFAFIIYSKPPKLVSVTDLPSHLVHLILFVIVSS
jgi:uncharacterized membrane protein